MSWKKELRLTAWVSFVLHKQLCWRFRGNDVSTYKLPTKRIWLGIRTLVTIDDCCQARPKLSLPATIASENFSFCFSQALLAMHSPHTTSNSHQSILRSNHEIGPIMLQVNSTALHLWNHGCGPGGSAVRSVGCRVYADSYTEKATAAPAATQYLSRGSTYHDTAFAQADAGLRGHNGVETMCRIVATAWHTVSTTVENLSSQYMVTVMCHSKNHDTNVHESFKAEEKWLQNPKGLRITQWSNG